MVYPQTRKEREGTIDYDSDSPMMRRIRNPPSIDTNNNNKVIPLDKNEENKKINKHLLSLMDGVMDYDGFPIDNDDYYGDLGSLGFWNTDTMTWFGPLVHDTDTTTALNFYDTSMKKTPIDKRLEVKTQNLSQVQQDYANADLYEIQDFGKFSSKRIKEKTHRILNDPTRKFQSQRLINIQTMKGILSDPKTKLNPMQRLESYNSMLLDVNTLLLERLTDVLDYQEKAYMYSKYETKPIGNNFYAEMTLTANAEATKIDFVDGSNNKNVPSNAKIYDLPKHNLISLQIYFDSGTNLYFATNKPSNSLDTFVKLTSPPIPYTMAPGGFALKSVNLRATGGDAAIRILGLY